MERHQQSSFHCNHYEKEKKNLVNKTKQNEQQNKIHNYSDVNLVNFDNSLGNVPVNLLWNNALQINVKF